MTLKKLIAIFLVPLVCLLNVPVTALAADTPKVKTKITHKPPKEITSGQRVTLDAKIKDPQGVDVTRVYFKSAQADDYLFVVMEKTAKNEYAGVLPAPSKGAESIDYLILVKNGADQVIKTQTYHIPVKDADKDAAAPAGEVQVYTELAEAPQQVVGFTDSIAVDVVESAVKFGYVAGLYHGMQTAATTASTGAVAGGTVAAGTTAIGVGTIALGVAAVVGAGVAIGSSGGGGSSNSSASATPSDTTPSDTTPSDTTPSDTTANIVGTWTGNLYFTSGYGFSCQYHIDMNLNSNGTGNAHQSASSSNPSYCDPTTSYSGRWEVNSGGNLELRDLFYDGYTITVPSSNFNASFMQLNNYPYDTGSFDVTLSK